MFWGELLLGCSKLGHVVLGGARSRLADQLQGPNIEVIRAVQGPAASAVERGTAADDRQLGEGGGRADHPQVSFR